MMVSFSVVDDRALVVDFKRKRTAYYKRLYYITL